jgi:hypothetical protein
MTVPNVDYDTECGVRSDGNTPANNDMLFIIFITIKSKVMFLNVSK